MWREVLRIINEGTVEGLVQSKAVTHDELFLQNLRHSNEVFAAFKVHTMGVEMAAKLIGEDGKLKPFDKWRQDVASICSHQTGAWLRTEYDTAVIRAHAAADWQEFERNRDIMPNLRWMPTTSPQPESSHAAYWRMKLTLPIDDPFWNDHHPGDRWNCKCSLEATDEPVNRPDDIEPSQPQRGLENNPGKDGHTFSDSHPYFPSSCATCPVRGASGFTDKLKGMFKNAKKDCYNCKFVNSALEKCQRIHENQKLYDRLSKDSRYIDVEYNPETGAVRATHRGHNRKPEHTNNRGHEFEVKLQKLLYDAGHSVILCDEQKLDGFKKRMGIKEHLAALDMILDGVRMDIKSIEKDKSFYGNPLIDKNNQLIRFNRRTDVHTPADTVCLYFDDPSMFAPEKITKGYDYMLAHTHDPIHLKHVICALNTKKGLLLKRFDF